MGGTLSYFYGNLFKTYSYCNQLESISTKSKFAIWSFLVSNIAYIYIKHVFFYHNIRQNLQISVLIICFIFNIHLPIYKHVFFNPKKLPRILYLSIILESLKNTLVDIRVIFSGEISLIGYVLGFFQKINSLFGHFQCLISPIFT